MRTRTHIINISCTRCFGDYNATADVLLSRTRWRRFRVRSFISIAYVTCTNFKKTYRGRRSTRDHPCPADFLPTRVFAEEITSAWNFARTWLTHVKMVLRTRRRVLETTSSASRFRRAHRVRLPPYYLRYARNAICDAFSTRLNIVRYYHIIHSRRPVAVIGRIRNGRIRRDAVIDRCRSFTRDRVLTIRS